MQKANKQRQCRTEGSNGKPWQSPVYIYLAIFGHRDRSEQYEEEGLNWKCGMGIVGSGG